MPAINISDLNNAKQDVDHIADIATSAALTATDRLGNAKQTMAGAIATIAAITNRGPWATATEYAAKDIVSESGDWHICVVPHTSSAAFATDAANWRVYQGAAKSDLASDDGVLMVGNAVDKRDLAASSGASMVGAMQSLSGAMPRIVESKLNDIVSIKDFGAVGNGIANDYAAWAALVSCYPADNATCILPVGIYTCDTAITIPQNIKISMEKGASIAPGALVHFTNVNAASANSSLVKPLETSLGASSDQSEFNYLELAGDSALGGNVVAHFADLVDTKQNVRSNAGGAYARYSEIRHGGAASSGGFVGMGGFSYMTSAGNPSATVKDSVGVAGYAASLGYNYGGTSGAEKGSVFGSNFYARLDSGATFFSNVSASEFNTEVRDGASVSYKSGIQIVGVATDAVAGSTYDCAIGISNQVGAIGRKHGILFGPMNGVHPVATTGTLIGHAGASTYATGIDFTGATFNTAVLKSNATTILDGGIVLGNDATATRFLDFKSQGNPPNYNARIHCTAGSSTNGSGDVSVIASVIRLPPIVPHGDATSNLGGASLRYNTLYASNGTINTSDAREKQQVSQLSDAERAVAQRLKSMIRTFKFNSAVEEKKDGARIHVGVIAQDVKAAFEAEGLVAEDYALLCYDEWSEQLETVGDDDQILTPHRPAGSRYGIRYEELLAFVVSAL